MEQQWIGKLNGLGNCGGIPPQHSAGLPQYSSRNLDHASHILDDTRPSGCREFTISIRDGLGVGVPVFIFLDYSMTVPLPQERAHPASIEIDTWNINKYTVLNEVSVSMLIES